MVIDTLTRIKKYSGLHPLFSKAFEYALSQNLDDIAVGKYEISGDDLKAIVSDKEGKTTDESLSKFECHDKHIDIQICIRGDEKIGWKPRENCTDKKEAYNAEKDVTFFNDRPDTFFDLTNHQFAIFFPEDVHAPMIGEGKIKKMVIKVKL